MRRAGVLAVLCAALSVCASLTHVARAESSAAAPSAEPAVPAARKSKAKGTTPAGAPKRAPLPADWMEALRGALAGADEAGALEAAGALGASGAPNAGDALVEALAMGATPARTQAALDALGKLAELGALAAVGERAIEVLDLYAGHRVPDLRRRAIKALGAIRDPRFAAAVAPILLARLGDAAPDVRAAAGEALAARREAKAAPRLYALVKRGDPGAAAPLAALATPDLVPQIAELAGTVEDGVLATTLGEYVKRDDVPDKLRVDVLRTIGTLSGAEATTALVEYVASVPAKDTRPSKREAQKLLDQRGSKP